MQKREKDQFDAWKKKAVKRRRGSNVFTPRQGGENRKWEEVHRIARGPDYNPKKKAAIDVGAGKKKKLC